MPIEPDPTELAEAASLAAAGKARLVEPATAVEGMRLLDQACRLGDGEAAAMVAVLLGAGFRTDQTWTGALHYLERAAEAGWAPAQAQLEVLRRGGAAVDLEAWLSPPVPQPVAASPRVAAYREFLPHAACAHLVGLAGPRIGPAQVYDRVSGASGHDPARSNSAADFSLLDLDLVMLVVQARIARTVGHPLHTLESPSVLHYAVGQSFEPHCDWLDRSTPGMAEDLARSGQRVATFLVYLNEDFEGGETAFPEAGVRHRGRAGDALLFHNVDAAGRPDPMSRHAGLPPTAGEKWILSQWVRARPGA